MATIRSKLTGLRALSVSPLMAPGASSANQKPGEEHHACAQTQLARRYRYWRATGLTARDALAYARTERLYRETFDRFGEWNERLVGTSYAMTADLDCHGYTIRATLMDDDSPPDWGDLDMPSEEERDWLLEHTSFYIVTVDVLDAAGDEVYTASIGGVDAIDLPGYISRTWELAAGFALVECLLPDAEHFCANEATERAEWAARDVVTT
jgi:hypothetical protein